LALEQMARSAYDLVLMDVHMPVMDGYTAASTFRELKRDRGAARLPILALTADAFRDAAEKSAAAGFDAHLTKPIRKATLLDAIVQYAHARDLAAPPVDATSQASPAAAVDDGLAAIVASFVRNVRRHPVAIAPA